MVEIASYAKLATWWFKPTHPLFRSSCYQGRIREY